MRRKSDKTLWRVLYLVLGLCGVLCILAAVMGYKAIRLIDKWEQAVSLFLDAAKGRRVPEGF